MFDCSPEALQQAIARVREEYPNSHINSSVARALFSLISIRYETSTLPKDQRFKQALRDSLTECHLRDEERDWYRTLAGSLFGKRGAASRKKRPHKKMGVEKEKTRISFHYTFPEGSIQGTFIF